MWIICKHVTPDPPPPLKLPPNISPLWGVFAPPVAIINTSLHPTTNTFGASLNFNVFTFSAERSRKDLFLPFSNFEHSISVLILSSVTPFPLYNYAMGPKYSVIFTQTYIPAPVSHWMTHTTNKQMSHPKNSTWCHNAMLKSILLIVTKRPLSELSVKKGPERSWLFFISDLWRFFVVFFDVFFSLPNPMFSASGLFLLHTHTTKSRHQMVLTSEPYLLYH